MSTPRPPPLAGPWATWAAGATCAPYPTWAPCLTYPQDEYPRPPPLPPPTWTLGSLRRLRPLCHLGPLHDLSPTCGPRAPYPARPYPTSAWGRLGRMRRLRAPLPFVCRWKKREEPEGPKSPDADAPELRDVHGRPTQHEDHESTSRLEDGHTETRTCDARGTPNLWWDGLMRNAEHTRHRKSGMGWHEWIQVKAEG